MGVSIGVRGTGVSRGFNSIGVSISTVDVVSGVVGAVVEFMVTDVVGFVVIVVVDCVAFVVPVWEKI